MITIDRLNNLITYWLLFNDINNDINDSTIDYIVEKYDYIFNKRIVNSKDLFEFFSADKKLQNITFSYCNKWGIPIDEMMNDDNFGVFIFTVYFTMSIDYKAPTPHELVDKYKSFFGSPKYINKRNVDFILHELLRKMLHNYKNLYPSLYRDIELKTKLKKLKKEDID